VLEQHPAVRAVLAEFPDAKLTAIRSPRIIRDDDDSATG
jgi:hypothetical protein